MERPVFHYDRIMGIQPDWRRVVTEALAGDDAKIRREILMLRGISPAASYSLGAMLDYARCGQNAYCVGPRMRQMFTDTDVNAVPKEFFHLPHRCFYVALPECPWELWGTPESGMHPFVGFYLQQHQDNGLMLVLWGKENAKSQDIGDDTILWIHIHLDEVPTVEKDGMTLMDFEAYIAKVLADPKRDTADRPEFRITDENRPQTTDVAINAIRVALNLVLYVNALDADVTRDTSEKDRRKTIEREMGGVVGRLHNPAKKRKAAQRYQTDLSKLSQATVIWLGKTIEEAPVSEDTPGSPHRSGGNAWSSRRGHWSRFWVGPRKTAEGEKRLGDRTVLKWVQPIYRSMTSIVASRGKQYRFAAEKKDWEDR